LFEETPSATDSPETISKEAIKMAQSCDANSRPVVNRKIASSYPKFGWLVPQTVGLETTSEIPAPVTTSDSQ
jgi:hypothetical protein